ncbi:MAG: hypothetical protein M3Z16_07375, partial [Pseudomonadota bacterium]|nr:hypothetical protein [Pseudomonadota bacterium]
NMVVNVAKDTTNAAQKPNNLDWGRDGAAFFMLGFATPIDGAVIAGVKNSSEAIELFGWASAVLDAKGNPANSQFVAANLEPTIAAQVAKGRSTVANNEVPFTIKNVVAYSTYGLMGQHLHLGGLLNNVDNVVIYGAIGGIADQYSTGLTVTNSKLYGQMFGGAFGNDWKTQLRVENTAIKGFNYGILVPQNGTTNLKNLDLANVVNLMLARVDQYQWAEIAPRSQIIGQNLTLSQGARYGYWASDDPGTWTDIAVPSDSGPPPGVETGFDASISVFFARAAEAIDRRHEGLFKPWNIQINGKQLYSDDQKPGFRVHDTGIVQVDGKSNTELVAMCNMSMMDQLMPAALAAKATASDGTFVDGDGIRIWGGRTGPLNPNTNHFLHGSIGYTSLIVTDQSGGDGVVYQQPYDSTKAADGTQKFFCLKATSGPETGRVFHWISDRF